MTGAWTIVIPVKGTTDAKSRLEAGEELALAIALDTVDAASVDNDVIVVTSVTAAQLFCELGARVITDPGGGLNAAIAEGLAAAVAETGSNSIAVLLGDLPALTSGELSRALELASAHPRALVADVENSGTVLITALRHHAHIPSFGAGSRAAHLRAGYIEVMLPSTSVLRRDVDTPEQLAALDAASLGRRTRSALRLSSATDPGQTDPGQTDPGQTDPGQTDPGQTTPGQTTPWQYV